MYLRYRILFCIFFACSCEKKADTHSVSSAEVPFLRTLSNSEKSFVKLDAEGNPLADQSMAWQMTGSEKENTQWSCIKDVHTGAIWEVKSSDPNSARSGLLNYAWYFDDESLHGGNTGPRNDKDCNGVRCDTQSYRMHLNTISLCGAKDWNLPTVLLFQTIVDHGRTPIASYVDLFPQSHNSHYWTRQSYAPNRAHAWYVYLSDGSVSNTLKDQPMFLRLVSVAKKAL